MRRKLNHGIAFLGLVVTPGEGRRIYPFIINFIRYYHYFQHHQASIKHHLFLVNSSRKRIQHNIYIYPLTVQAVFSPGVLLCKARRRQAVRMFVTRYGRLDYPSEVLYTYSSARLSRSRTSWRCAWYFWVLKFSN